MELRRLNESDDASPRKSRLASADTPLIKILLLYVSEYIEPSSWSSHSFIKIARYVMKRLIQKI